MPPREFESIGPNLYGKYLQGSINWAELIHPEDLGEIYAGGYLPYSGDTSDSRDLFYMSRSLKVDTADYLLEKKRRYDHREWQAFALQRISYPKNDFLDRYGSIMTDLAYKWMEPRFGDASLPRERFFYILGKPFLNTILAWHHRDELVAFALVASGTWGAHYWYVFYKNGTGIQAPSGHGYLVDFINWSCSRGMPYAYLGTSYARKSQYKSRGIKGISFWDGAKWNRDKDELARLLDEDEELLVS